MQKVRSQIQNGLKLSFYDNDTPGSNSTDVSWGLCTKDHSIVDEDMRIFPEL
jgi:hypothetical protein